MSDNNEDDIVIDDSGIYAVLEDPAASYWLKAALDGALNRDPVDAANDAEVMARILAKRAEKLEGLLSRQDL
jgi:uncharacterized protein with PIN domain